MDRLKEVLEKLKGILDSGSSEELSATIEEAEGVYAEELDVFEENKSDLSIEELKEVIALFEELQGVIVKAKEVLDAVEEDIEDIEDVEDAEEREGLEGKEEEGEETNIEKRSEEGMRKGTVINATRGKKSNYREAFKKYLRTEEKMDGLTTDSEGVIIKEEEFVNDTYEPTESLEKLVTVKKVNTAKGTHYEPNYDGIKAMKTVEELAESPKYKGVESKAIQYEVKTYREAIVGSRELADDMEDFDVYVYRIAKEKATVTKNVKILEAIENDKDIKTVKVSTVADFVTPNLANKYRKGFVLSETAYNKIARLKDSEGRFLLHNDLTQPVPTTILGDKNVVVYPDDEIGADTALYGDLKQAIVLFDRKDITVKWEAFLHYGKVVQPVVRFDVQVVNPDAVVKLDIAELEELPQE